MNLRANWPARAVALATIGYGTAMTIAPKVLAKPCGLTGPDGSVPEEVAGLIRSIGVRDVALAVALALAPAGYPLRLLTAARMVSDGADAIWFSRLVSDAPMKLKVAGVAGGWALLEALTGLPGGAAGA
jgi:hypothetical protein